MVLFCEPMHMPMGLFIHAFAQNNRNLITSILTNLAVQVPVYYDNIYVQHHTTYTARTPNISCIGLNKLARSIR
jgi:hypothetical protein